MGAICVGMRGHVLAGIWASCWLLRCHLYPQVDEMDQRLRDAGFKFAFSPIHVKFRPTAKVRGHRVSTQDRWHLPHLLCCCYYCWQAPPLPPHPRCCAHTHTYRTCSCVRRVGASSLWALAIKRKLKARETSVSLGEGLLQYLGFHSTLHRAPP